LRTVAARTRAVYGVVFLANSPAIGCKKRLLAHRNARYHSLARVMQSIPSVLSQKYVAMKPRLWGPCGIANPRDTTRYRCGLRLAWTPKPTLSSCNLFLRQNTSCRIRRRSRQSQCERCALVGLRPCCQRAAHQLRHGSCNAQAEASACNL
jgi:hypothetical protein